MSVVATSKLAVTLRQARAHEGELIHSLADASGKWRLSDMDWSFDPSLYWFVAEYEGQAVGCVQAVPGVPFGHIEFLCVLPTLSHSVQAIVVRDLCELARTSCLRAGAQFVSFALHPGLEGWARVLEHRGAVTWFDGGTVMVMRA